MPRYGVTARYALLHDTSGTFGDVHAAGATLRWSPFGDVRLDGNVTVYPDLTFFRLAPAWRVPLGDLFFVEPGAAVQLMGDGAKASGNLTLGVEGSLGALWMGGKYGRETRPTSLPLLEIYDVLSDVRYGLWAGARVRVVDRFYLFGSWAMNALETEQSGVASDSQHHLFSVGVARW